MGTDCQFIMEPVTGWIKEPDCPLGVTDNEARLKPVAIAGLISPGAVSVAVIVPGLLWAGIWMAKLLRDTGPFMVRVYWGDGDPFGVNWMVTADPVERPRCDTLRVAAANGVFTAIAGTVIWLIG